MPMVRIRTHQFVANSTRRKVTFGHLDSRSTKHTVGTQHESVRYPLPRTCRVRSLVQDAIRTDIRSGALIAHDRQMPREESFDLRFAV